MQQFFYINQNSELPTLKMEVIYDGRGDFHKVYSSLQNCEITFSMMNIDSGVYKVSNAPCYIKKRESEGCVEKYDICYDWKKRDTKDKGTYKGVFEIDFGQIKGESMTFPSGKLIMPIREELIIVIR